jgi:tRNA(adenine34) deaminase
METDENWMSSAIEIATASSIDVPIGCVIAHDGKQIAAASNMREAENDPAGHAEIVALRQAANVLNNWRLLDCTVYVTLEPCAMCAEAMIQSRVKRIVFGAYDQIAGAAGSRFNLFAQREGVPVPEITGGICEDRCRQLIQDFFRQRRQKGDAAANPAD